MIKHLYKSFKKFKRFSLETMNTINQTIRQIDQGAKEIIYSNFNGKDNNILAKRKDELIKNYECLYSCSEKDKS